MSQLSQADQYLIQQIRDRNEDGWRQVVERYQGRLLAFARSQLRDNQEAEDLVQETFVGLLKGLDRFQFVISLESCLFTIMRRRLVDSFRKSGRAHHLRMCSPRSSSQSEDREANDGQADLIDHRSLSASTYADQNEQRLIQERNLWQALHSSIDQMRDETKFRDLQVFEMIFYAQMRNKEIAELIGVDQKQIAVMKHRFVKRLAESTTCDSAATDLLLDESVLSRLWEEYRPSCPKRSTLGKMLLGLLSSEWCEYIHFHVETLGCRACQANFQDLKNETDDRPTHTFSDRIMQSSIGFFRK